MQVKTAEVLEPRHPAGTVGNLDSAADAGAGLGGMARIDKRKALISKAFPG